MKNRRPFPVAAALLAIALPPCLPVQANPDWPQWRGPLRNGIAMEPGSLPATIDSSDAVAPLWSSEHVPSDHDGGHGSVAISGGRCFLSVVWHHDVPTEERRLDGRVMGDLGYRSTKFSDELNAKMEEARLNLNPRLRGKALEDWAKAWVEENLSEEEALKLGSWVIGRFKQGKQAVSLKDFEILASQRNKVFESQAAMEAWLSEQDLEPGIMERVIAVVPNTKKAADDTILCLDANTGETLWKFTREGYPSGRASSSTPAVVDGVVYGALSTHLYALDAEKGEVIWQTELTGRKGPASSPLVHGGKVFLQQNFLTAFDAESGEVLWENKEVSGSNQSPAIWDGGSVPVVICNGSKEVLGVNAESGEVAWRHPGGGDGTPVVSGDYLVVTSKTADHNLSAYKLEDGKATPLWSKGFLAQRYGSSPIIYEGHIYHLGSARHLCVNLETGEIAWERKASSNLSSPIVADGKLFCYENNGGFLAMLAASPEDYQPLGRAKIGALRCASPAIVGQKLYLRTPEKVSCFDLSAMAGGDGAE